METTENMINLSNHHHHSPHHLHRSHLNSLDVYPSHANTTQIAPLSSSSSTSSSSLSSSLIDNISTSSPSFGYESNYASLMTVTDLDNHTNENSSISNSLTIEHLNKLFLEYIFPSDYEWLLIAMYLIVFIVGLVGNFLVCFAVWRNKQMRTVTNIFIFNLSTADLMVIILVLPATVTVDVTETWFAGLIMCKCLMFLQNISVSVSVLTLTAISVERFYAICHPLRFRSTKKRARMVIGAIWLFSILVSSHEAIIFQTIPTSNHTVLLTSCRPPNEYFDQSICYHAILALCLYLLPLGFMSVTYVRIAMTLWSNNIPSENGSMPTDPALSGSSSSGSNNQMTNQVMARRNVAKMLIVVVIAFAVCYMPIHCANFLRYLKVGIEEHPELMSGLWFIAHWLCYFNSAVNPIIYNFMSAKFRMEFAETCRICCCCTSSCPIRLSNRGMNTVRNQSLNSLKYTVNNTQVDQFTLSTFNTDDGKKKLCQRSILRNAHPLQ